MLFISVHPEHARNIFLGHKTVELRKRIPRCSIGTTVIIYASSPQCEVLGLAWIDNIDAESPEIVWQKYGGRTSIDRNTFDSYYHCCDIAVCISLTRIQRFATPISLGSLRRAWRGFHPPQEYRYLESAQQELIHVQPLSPAIFG